MVLYKRNGVEREGVENAHGHVGILLWACQAVPHTLSLVRLHHATKAGMTEDTHFSSVPQTFRSALKAVHFWVRRGGSLAIDIQRMCFWVQVSRSCMGTSGPFDPQCSMIHNHLQNNCTPQLCDMGYNDPPSLHSGIVVPWPSLGQN